MIRLQSILSVRNQVLAKVCGTFLTVKHTAKGDNEIVAGNTAEAK